MRTRTWISLAALFFETVGLQAQITQDVLTAKPQAIIDLRTTAGAGLVHGQWRYSDARIQEIDHHSVGPDLRPTGPPN